jgi:kynurenine 3-monooxygenase
MLYESRQDLRTADIGAGRSINLALATRGIVPLIDIGVIEQVDAITIPMRGRMVHAAGENAPTLQMYGTKAHEVIHSVSRSDLNAILLNAAEATGRITINFETELASVDFEESQLRFADGASAPFGVVFGADGAGSRVRASIEAQGACNFETQWLGHGYKELTLARSKGGEHRLNPNALHIWPRGDFMLIALANPGGDFTVTLFAPTETLETLTSPEAVDTFFNVEFDKFAALMPDLADQFIDNPTGSLGTVRASGWSFEDRAVLVGDAAHAIVPFHGQGMNAAMESVRVLDQHLRASSGDLAGAFRDYESGRKPDTDAIADMALNNYVEMRSSVVDPGYLTKRDLALELQQRHPARISPRYNMVMFSTMPYAEAQARAAEQAKIIAAALDNTDVDVDALVTALSPLPALDPLADPNALSVT